MTATCFRVRTKNPVQPRNLRFRMDGDFQPRLLGIRGAVVPQTYGSNSEPFPLLTIEKVDNDIFAYPYNTQ